METKYELVVAIADSPEDLAGQAAADASEALKAAIAASGRAVLLVSAGRSQDELCEALMAKDDVDWSKVVLIGDAEFVGKGEGDASSARAYLTQHVVALCGQAKAFQAVHLVDGAADASAECARMAAVVAAHPVDVALLAIGQGGEFGGNKLPANVTTKDAFIVHDGVITMSVEQLLHCKKIVCALPGKNSAPVCKNLTEGTPGPANPAAFLQAHPNASVYMDQQSSHLLKTQLAKGQGATPPQAAPSALGPPAKGFVLRTFRPGHGWVEIGANPRNNVLTGKLDPMAQRKLQLEKKKAAAAAARKI